MSGEVQLRPATAEDAHRLAPTMRPGDILESLAWTGEPPLETLLYCLGASAEAWTASLDGEVMAMLGVVTTDIPEVGIMWMLSGDAVNRHKKAFLKGARKGLQLMLGVRPILTNAVDARYAGAVRLVEWLGFRFLREVHAPGGERFLQVAIGRPEWQA